MTATLRPILAGLVLGLAILAAFAVAPWVVVR